MTVSVVNNGSHSDYSGGSVSSRAVSFTGVAVGNLLVARIYFYTGTLNAFTDSVDGATGWNLCSGSPVTTRNGGKLYYYWKKVTSAGSYTTTADYQGGNATYTDLTAHEFQSTNGAFSATPTAGAVNANHVSVASGSNVISTGNVTPSGSPGFIVASLDDEGSGGTITAGTGYTTIGNGGAKASWGIWKALSDTNAVAATWSTTATFSGTSYGVVFLEPAGAGGTSPKFGRLTGSVLLNSSLVR